MIECLALTHRLLGRHVRLHRRVAQRLRAHDALHVGGPAELAGDEAARRLGEALRDDAFSVLSPRISFISLHSGSKSALSSSKAFFSSSDSSNLSPSFVTDTSFLPSYSLSCCTQYSWIGSTMKRTSKLRFLQRSMKGDVSAA